MLILLFIILVAALALLNVLCGSVDIPAAEVFRIMAGEETVKASWRYIVMESRVPQMVTALLCGASLSASGLLLQTCFRNPLAGPSILGITNGASLGVAIVMLLTGGVIGIGSNAGGGLQLVGYMAVVAGALAGAMLVIMLLVVLSGTVRSSLMLLIVGIMVSYLTSSVVSLLNFFASEQNVHSYVMWGMGSFSDVSMRQLPWFSLFSVAGLVMSLLLTKSLDALLLGDVYAQNLGVSIRVVRRLILLATGVLTAVATAFCGPVAFIGLAVPHIARLMSHTATHRILMPMTMLVGAAVALLCNLICSLPQNTVIPLNAVTPIFGAPVIIYIIMRKN